MIHNISGFLPLPLPHSLFPFMLVLTSWSKSVACLTPKMDRWPKTGVVVVKKSGGNGHCGHHMHSNPVKSSVKLQMSHGSSHELVGARMRAKSRKGESQKSQSNLFGKFLQNITHLKDKRLKKGKKTQKTEDRKDSID